MAKVELSNISPLGSDDEYDGNDFLDYTQEILSTGSYHTDSTRDRLASSHSISGWSAIPTFVELHETNSTFIDYEIGMKPIGLTFSLERDLGSSEFIAITIFCIPNCTLQDDFVGQVEKKRIKGVDFLDLVAHLVYHGDTPFQLLSSDLAHLQKTSKVNKQNLELSIPIKKALFNGEYCITLNNRHERIRAGNYVLWLKSNDSSDSSAGYGKKDEVQFSNIQIETLKINYEVVEEVEATAVIPNSPIVGSVFPGQYIYYRLVLVEKDRVLRCSIKQHEKQIGKSRAAVLDDATFDTLTSSRVDIYVTNRFSGLRPVTKNTAIWTTEYQINQAIEILPGDPKLSQNYDDVGANIFIIAVYSNSDQFDSSNPISYQLMIEVVDYVEITKFSTTDIMSTGIHEHCNSYFLSLTLNKYNFFAVEFDPCERDQIAITLTLAKPNLSKFPPINEHFKSVVDLRAQKQLFTRSYLQGISAEFFLMEEILTKCSIQGDLNGESVDEVKLKDNSYLILLYISNEVKYPQETDHVWMASANDEVSFIIDTSDWKYVGNTCYFSVFIIHLNLWIKFHNEQKMRKIPEVYELVEYLHLHGRSDSTPGQMVNAQLSVWCQGEEELLKAELKSNTQSDVLFQRYKLFHEIFQYIDGNRLSFKERKSNFRPGSQQMAQSDITNALSKVKSSERLGISFLFDQEPGHYHQISSSQLLFSHSYVDDTTLSYSEIEFSGFFDLLNEIPALDGHIFYDLGCGIGKVLIAAMLSGVRFLKIIGIEILPLLAQCAKDIVNHLMLENETDINTDKNTRDQYFPFVSSTRAPRSAEWRNDDHTEIKTDLNKPATPVWLRQGYQSNIEPQKSYPKQYGEESDNEDMDAEFFSLEKIKLNTNGDFFEEGSQSSQSYSIHHIIQLKEKLKKAKASLPIFEIRNENMLESCWTDGDIIFTNSICFSDYFLDLLFEKAKLLKKGAKWITCKLPDEYRPYFTLEKSLVCSFTCGVTEVHVLVRSNVSH